MTDAKLHHHYRNGGQHKVGEIDKHVAGLRAVAARARAEAMEEAAKVCWQEALVLVRNHQNDEAALVYRLAEDIRDRSAEGGE